MHEYMTRFKHLGHFYLQAAYEAWRCI